NHLLLALDGELVHVQFEVLPVGDACRLIDQFVISYVNTARDLLRQRSEVCGEPESSIIGGDPDFDLGAPATAGAAPSANAQPEASFWTRWFRGLLDKNRSVAPSVLPAQPQLDEVFSAPRTVAPDPLPRPHFERVSGTR